MKNQTSAELLCLRQPRHLRPASQEPAISKISTNLGRVSSFFGVCFTTHLSLDDELAPVDLASYDIAAPQCQLPWDPPTLCGTRYTTRNWDSCLCPTMHDFVSTTRSTEVHFPSSAGWLINISILGEKNDPRFHVQSYV